MTERITDSQLLGELGETAIKKFVLKMQLIYCSAATDASRGRSAVHRFPEERGSAWAESWLAPALLGAASAAKPGADAVCAAHGRWQATAKANGVCQPGSNA